MCSRASVQKKQEVMLYCICTEAEDGEEEKEELYIFFFISFLSFKHLTHIYTLT